MKMKISNTFKNHKKGLLFILMIIIGILFFYLNLVYPFLPDDWLYSFKYGPEYLTHERVNSLSDVLYSQYNHYFLWGGRTIVHIINQTLLMFDIKWMSILNSCVFVSYLFLLYKYSNKSLQTNLYLLILLLFLCFFAHPAFFETFLWKTGSANYLWGSTIILLFLYPYYNHFRSKVVEENILKSILFLIFGIIAGWTNENMSIALIFFIVVLGIKFKKEKITIPYWYICGLIGLIIGTLFMMLAPGNFVRMDSMEEIKHIFPSISTVYKNFLRYLLRIIIPYIALVYLYRKFPKNNEEKKNIIFISALFVISACVALLSMSVPPIFPKRALFGIITFIVIGIGIIYANIDFNRMKKLKIANVTVIIIMIILFGIEYYSRYKTLEETSSFWKEREIYVKEQKALGNDSIVFTTKAPVKDKYSTMDLTDDPNNWVNGAYSLYYGLKSVKVIDETKPEKE